MSRFDQRRRGAPAAVIVGTTIALFALAAGSGESTLADERRGDALPVEERSTEMRPVDGLGASRLFFTAEERRVMTHGEPGRSPGPLGSTRAVREGERESNSAPNRRAAGSAPKAEPEGATGADRSGRERPGGSAPGGIVFQALLNAAGRAQIMLGGRLCRAKLPANGSEASAAAPLALQCAAMPAGVRAVRLLRQEKRVLVTLSDGSRRHLALGESVSSP